MLAVTHIIPLIEKNGLYPFSGAENHLFTLMECQVESGMKIEFIPLILSNGELITEKLSQLEKLGVIVRPLFCNGAPKHFSIALIWSLSCHMRKTRRDVLHTHLDIGDLYGRIAGWLSGCRTIVSSNHNNEPYYSTIRWKVKLRLLDILTSHHVAISEAVRDHLIHTVGIRRDKVSIINYGIKIVARSDIRFAEEFRRIHAIDKASFVVGFVGRLEEQKNVPLLLDALRMLKGIVCVIIGTGTQLNELKAMVSPDYNCRVLFLGYLPNASYVMPAFDLLCLPSKWEGLGLVLLEAMAQRVPIAGARAGAIPEILDGGRCGLLFSPYSADELRAQILFAQQNRKELRTLAEKAYERVRTRYTTERMCELTRQLYQRIVTNTS